MLFLQENLKFTAIVLLRTIQSTAFMLLEGTIIIALMSKETFQKHPDIVFIKDLM